MEHHSKKVTAASLLVTLGIIYGDIGTSPLYVMKAIVEDDPVSQELVYGSISLVFWTLVFQTSIKYIWLTLKADNQGEGGIFSLYALVKRHGKQLAIPTIIGASTLLADGIITPPISVSSAVEGLSLVNGLDHIPTVPIVIVIISLIFFFQRFGTQKVGIFFGPVMLIWFSMLMLLGINSLLNNRQILTALSPHYGINLLVKHPGGFWLLGAVFLCTTGAEALYSDLGHCGIRNIRISWTFVKVSLLLNYLGQASWMLGIEGQQLNGQNPFFEIMPDWFLLPGIIIATMAAIIASQALISGSFTLINEAMNLNFWPRVAVKQPSESKGQIFIPSTNAMLWLGCILMVLYFRNSKNMEAAYGLAITLTMLVTTFLLSYFLKYRLKWNKVLVFGTIMIFGLIEMSFFIANIKKFPEGGYITLIISSAYILIMLCIYYGRKMSNRFTRFVHLNDYKNIITELSEDDQIPKYATHLVYLTKANYHDNIEEKIVKSILSKKPKRADVYWFIHIERTSEPYTNSYEVLELVDDKIIKININLGFRRQIRTEQFFKKIISELVAKKELNLHIRPDGSTKYNPEPDLKFVIIEKFLSIENEFALGEGFIINAYFFLKKLGQSDQRFFGLEKNDVKLEHIPLIVHRTSKVPLIRIQ